MGIFDFLQNIGALGQMVKNVVQIYKKLQQEPFENDLERIIAMVVIRYSHPSVPNRATNRAKVLSHLQEKIEIGEPIGLFEYCRGVAWAEMDVEGDDIESLKNILKIIRSSGVDYDDAYGKNYELEDFERILEQYSL